MLRERAELAPPVEQVRDEILVKVTEHPNRHRGRLAVVGSVGAVSAIGVAAAVLPSLAGHRAHTAQRSAAPSVPAAPVPATLDTVAPAPDQLVLSLDVGRVDPGAGDAEQSPPGCA